MLHRIQYVFYKSGKNFDLKNKLMKKERLNKSTWFLNKIDFQTFFLILQFNHKYYHWNS